METVLNYPTQVLRRQFSSHSLAKKTFFRKVYYYFSVIISLKLLDTKLPEAEW